MKIRTKAEVLARQYGEKAATAAQLGLARSAELVATVPTRTRGALKRVATLAARVEPMAEAPLATLETVSTLGAKRLKAASEATSLDALYQGQLALMPETKAAALAETRKYLELFFAAKAKADDAMKARVLGWVTPKPVRARKAPAAAPVAAPATDAAAA